MLANQIASNRKLSNTHATNGRPPTLSVVIPAYNEAATIQQLLERVMAPPFQKEVIVVDDGSTDGTRQILTELHAPPLRVLLHERNQGKGSALQTGFAAATGDYVIVQDADLEYDPQDYATILEPLLAGHADVVYGSRFLGGSRRVLFFWHMVANKVLTIACNMVTNLNLSDMETGYKAFRLEIVKQLDLQSKCFDVEPEITAKVARLSCRVYEVPISYHGRTYEEGKKIGWRDGLTALWAIMKYGLIRPRPQASVRLGHTVEPSTTSSGLSAPVTMQGTPRIGTIR